MKRALLSITMFSALAGLGITVANAADLEPVANDPVPEPVIATQYDWSGAYAGINLGVGFAGDFDNNAGLNLNTGAAFLGGGVIGYNYQIDKFVIGGEADFNYTGFDASAGGFNAELNGLGTVTARAGFTPIDRVLTYVEGGYAFGLSELSTAGASDRNFHSGFVVGAGTEYAVTDNVITGVEYNYVNLQSRTFNLGAAGTPSSDFDGHNVKFNLKYKF